MRTSNIRIRTPLEQRFPEIPDSEDTPLWRVVRTLDWREPPEQDEPENFGIEEEELDGVSSPPAVYNHGMEACGSSPASRALSCPPLPQAWSSPLDPQAYSCPPSCVHEGCRHPPIDLNTDSHINFNSHRGPMEPRAGWLTFGGSAVECLTFSRSHGSGGSAS